MQIFIEIINMKQYIYKPVDIYTCMHTYICTYLDN